MLKIKKVRNCHFGKIVVPTEFLESRPVPQKLIKKTADYLINGNLEKIYIDKDFNLVDGYCSYLIAEELGLEKVGKALKIRMIRDGKNGENRKLIFSKLCN